MMTYSTSSQQAYAGIVHRPIAIWFYSTTAGLPATLIIVYAVAVSPSRMRSAPNSPTGMRRPRLQDHRQRAVLTGPCSRGKTARYYLARTGEEQVVQGPSADTGEPEHHEWRWVSFDEAYDLASPRVREVVRWARQIIGA